MLVFGKNVATEVINSKTKIKKVFVTKNFDNKYIDYVFIKISALIILL